MVWFGICAMYKDEYVYREKQTRAAGPVGWLIVLRDDSCRWRRILIVAGAFVLESFYGRVLEFERRCEVVGVYPHR